MRALRPIRPPIAIERAYHKKLKALLKEMDRSLYYWLRAEYRKAEPEIVGDSAMADLRTKMKYLAKYWNKKYNEKETQVPLREPDLLMVITGGEMAYTRGDGVKIIPIGTLRD